MHEVVHFSSPSPVHMSDEWFKIASHEHFWIRRRFDVLRKIGKNLNFTGAKIAEIGCGNGLLQKQIEQSYGALVDGFDLNAEALRDSVAKNHPRFCYDIFERKPQLNNRYDFLFLFDVLEHVEREYEFLDAALFHVKPGGCLLINVPALMTFYSAYDKVVGHQRRYSLEALEKVCAKMGLEKVISTYWGMPLMPVLLLRNLRVALQSDPRQVIQSGYKPPGRFANRILSWASALELIPQRCLGTSLMAIYRKPMPLPEKSPT